jgi:alpha-aminoadipate carrier protein LysW
MVACPECDAALDIVEDEVDAGEVFVCAECGTQVEVVSTDPLQVAAVEEEGYEDDSIEPLNMDDDEDA